MEDAPKTLAEEAFKFPKYAALFDQKKKLAYAMGLVKQLHVSKIVPVRVGPGHLDRTTVYQYDVKIDLCTAVLVRSAWLRPIGSMDGAGPLKIQVLIDDVVALDQPVDEHLWAGHPSPRRACACNDWQRTAECRCPATMLSCGALSGVFPAIGVKEPDGAVAVQTIGEADEERPYGIFAPNETLIQIRVVKPGRDPVDFQARCGLTAALYSTRMQDVPA